MSKTRIFLSIKKVSEGCKEFSYYSPLIHLTTPPVFQIHGNAFLNNLIAKLYHRDAHLHVDEAFTDVQGNALAQ